MVIQQWVGARIGLMGNPSDGFGGKTISCLVRDFGAVVTLRESRVIEIVRHPIYDPLTFENLPHLTEMAVCDGYYGGVRLLYAACKRFCEACLERGLVLPRRNFALAYDTDIPRQVGLAGSSAIITAAFRALMSYYEVTEQQLPRSVLPNLLLSVETQELGIAAGLQDRVIQVFGGLVYMDFDHEYVEANGHGYYEELDPGLIPPLYLAWDTHGSDSGGIHSPVRQRFLAGDPEVLEAVRLWAGYADEARQALLDRDVARLGHLMDCNFDLRRRIYGDEHLGPRNLQAIQTARGLGLPAKFSGSGGAIFGVCEDPERFMAVQREFSDLGWQCCRPVPVCYEELEATHVNGMAMSRGFALATA